MIQTANAPAPTEETYGDLQLAYDHFNRELFEGTLPKCLITLQRKRHIKGYVSIDRFANTDGLMAHEIALNPIFFTVQTIEQSMMILVHQAAHIWQVVHGQPGRAGYHNAQFSDVMEAVGLFTTSDGTRSGSRTGDHVRQLPIEGGRFEVACRALLSRNFALRWFDRFPPIDIPAHDPDSRLAAGVEFQGSRLIDGLLTDAQTAQMAIDMTGDGRPKKRKLSKYRCSFHDINLWGKPHLKVLCGICEVEMQQINSDLDLP